MKLKSIAIGLMVCLLCGAGGTVKSQETNSAPVPVTPNASPEARALLNQAQTDNLEPGWQNRFDKLRARLQD